MTKNNRVLVVAAHPDDEVLGCGGTAARHADAGDEVHILIMAEGATARADEGDGSGDCAEERKALRAAAETAAGILGAELPAFADFPDNRMDTGMTLRAASMDSNGTVSQEQVIDDSVCDCCRTDIAIASSGRIAVYRDRTEQEIRDIYITRRIEGAWQTGVPISDDGWEIAGCPVNGPAIVAQGDLVAVV